MAAHAHHVRQHARSGGLAIGARERGNGHAARPARREHHVHHLAGDVARLALTGCDVHAEARAGVDLANAGAVLLVADGDVLAEEVDATDVEPHRLDHALGHLAVVGVDDIRHVDGRAAGREVGGLAQQHRLVLLRHGVEGVALLGKAAHGLRVDVDLGELLLVTDAAARVAVERLDQLLDRALAVADDAARHAQGRRFELAVDDQQAMVEALDHLLHQHAVREFLRDVVGDLKFVFVAHVHGHALAVIAVDRLEHDRVADLLRRLDRAVELVDQPLFRHRQAEVAEDAIGQRFVLGDLGRDHRGVAGRRGLDALLVLAVAHLDQALVVEPEPGNASRLGRLDERAGGRAQRLLLGQMQKVVVVLRQLRPGARRAIAEGDEIEQVECQLTGHQAHFLLVVAVEHVALLALRHRPRLGKAGADAGLPLQLQSQRGMDRRRLAVRRQPVASAPARELVEQRRQRLAVGGAITIAAVVHREADRAILGVAVGADEDAGMGDFHGGSLECWRASGTRRESSEI